MTRIAKLKTVMQVVAIAVLMACSASERYMPGLTRDGLIGLWIAAALTCYTGYAYLQAGIMHARRSLKPKQPHKRPRDDEASVFRFDAPEDRPLGRRFRAVAGDVNTVSDLIAALRARGPEYAEAFRNTERLRCAVNQTHVDFNASVAANDEIAFFPPVTGG